MTQGQVAIGTFSAEGWYHLCTFGDVHMVPRLQGPRWPLRTDCVHGGCPQRLTPNGPKLGAPLLPFSRKWTRALWYIHAVNNT